MKQRLLLFCLLLALGVVSAAFADTTAIQDWGFNVNGTWYCNDSGLSCGAGSVSETNMNSVPGLKAAAFDQTGTGLGTLTFTTTTGGYFGAWIFDAVSTPDYNEYGLQSGTPQSDAVATQSWQIDLPDYDGPDGNHSGAIIANSMGGTLDNKNHIPGTADDYFGTCSTGADCNDITSMAMGFTLAAPPAGFQDVVTLNLSHSKPSGFYLQQIHPPDPNNGSEGDVFFTGSAAQQPSSGPPPVPEPSSWLLLGTAITYLGARLRRKVSESTVKKGFVRQEGGVQ